MGAPPPPLGLEAKIPPADPVAKICDAPLVSQKRIAAIPTSGNAEKRRRIFRRCARCRNTIAGAQGNALSRPTANTVQAQTASPANARRAPGASAKWRSCDRYAVGAESPIGRTCYVNFTNGAAEADPSCWAFGNCAGRYREITSSARLVRSWPTLFDRRFDKAAKIPLFVSPYTEKRYAAITSAPRSSKTTQRKKYRPSGLKATISPVSPFFVGFGRWKGGPPALTLAPLSRQYPRAMYLCVWLARVGLPKFDLNCDPNSSGGGAAKRTVGSCQAAPLLPCEILLSSRTCSYFWPSAPLILHMWMLSLILGGEWAAAEPGGTPRNLTEPHGTPK